ncbi:MAG TPA: macro domain-containing protein [Desulfosalsimonadaceae bacterium]|nr:macro domain-containing protein [Desulfosalsimonadaceae bacterium]
MQEVINGVAIEVVKGDIAGQTDIAAVVNAANAELRMGGGVAGAIHMAAGPGLEEECRPLAPIRPGEAVITGGHNLPNDHVIHCLGPIYGRDKPEDRLLADCYRNALNLAEKHQLPTIAFPAISTGAFGYPTKDAAKIALQTIREQIPQLVNVQKIRFVLYSQGDYEVFTQLLA